jgi:uncharacterized membrane protein
MITVRRFLVLQALMVWQGGFLFYASVVVPAGTEVLGSSAAQGSITARVTDTMNQLGLVALAILALDLRLTRDTNEARIAARWWCWSLAFLCQLLLIYLHMVLDFFMDPARNRIVIGPPFRPVHRVYLWTISFQWFLCLLLAWFSLRAWRAQDRLEVKASQ